MLKISPSEFTALRRHGEETYPLECCGVLLGRVSTDGQTRTVERAVRCTNQNTERGHDRYVIDPRDLVRIQREGRAAGLDIVGFYHSHPDWPARWSQTDFAEAHWLGCSYVITRTEKTGAKDSNAFVLLGTSEDDKHFEPEPLETAETAAASEHRISC